MNIKKQSKTKIKRVAGSEASQLLLAYMANVQGPATLIDKTWYQKLHRWVIKQIPKPKICPICKIRKVYDLANKGIYDLNLKNWQWLCRKCHMESDGRLTALRLQKWNNQKELLKTNKKIVGYPDALDCVLDIQRHTLKNWMEYIIGRTAKDITINEIIEAIRKTRYFTKARGVRK